MFPHQARVLEGLVVRVVAVQEPLDTDQGQREQSTVAVVAVVAQESLAALAALAS